MTDIAKDVLDLVAEAAGMEAADLKLSDRLVEDLQLDSMGLLNLAFELEKYLEVELPDSSVRGAMTVGQLIDEVKQRTTTTQ